MSISSKIVVLRLDGDFYKEGFKVNVELGRQGRRPDMVIQGSLPGDLNLEKHLQIWRQTYRQRMISTRLKSGKVIYDVSRDEFGSLENDINCIRSSAKKLEILFKNWLDFRGFRQLDTQLREELNLDDDIQAIVRSENLTVHQLPWHSWDLIERYKNSEIAISPLVFKREAFDRKLKIFGDKRVRILAILGNTDGINVSADGLKLQKLSDADVTILRQPRIEEVNDSLWRNSWDILFFAGHSETQEDTGRIYVNSYEYLTLSELKGALRNSVKKGLQLAIFNSCDGLGLAKELDNIYIPRMIVMKEPIPDEVAQQFLEYFLKSFSDGAPLHLAVRAARNRLQGLEKYFPCATWLPIIFQNPAEIPPTWKDFRDYESQCEISKEVKGESEDRQDIHKKSRVIERITEDNPGRVWACSTSWTAILSDKVSHDKRVSLEPGDFVSIIGVRGNILLVLPEQAIAQDILENNSRSKTAQSSQQLKAFLFLIFVSLFGLVGLMFISWSDFYKEKGNFNFIKVFSYTVVITCLASPVAFSVCKAKPDDQEQQDLPLY